MGRIEQELREKIVGYEDDWRKRSRKLTTERISDKFDSAFEDKITSTGELERVYKEVRLIKNTHDVEMNKLLEENKKLKKIIEDSTSGKEKTGVDRDPESVKTIGKLNE